MTSSTRLLQQKLLINRLITKKGRKGLAKGFTLIELMIVVAIIGILSAVAIPQFLGVRDRAAASARVGEIVGLAKECAVGQVTKVEQGPSVTEESGIDVNGTCDGGDAVEISTPTLDSVPAGVGCLASKSEGGETKATITISTSGAMSCGWS